MGDRSPEIEDLEAMAEQILGVGGGKVTMDTSNRGCGGLVDVDIGYRLASLWGIV